MGQQHLQVVEQAACFQVAGPHRLLRRLTKLLCEGRVIEQPVERACKSFRVRRVVQQQTILTISDLILDSADAADIVIIAVPGQGIDETLDSVGPLDGKIVIDVTNALRMNAQRMMEISVDTSAGEIIQSRLPGARVVKAFNAAGSHVMANPTAGGGPVTIPIAGNDETAKLRVAALVDELGFASLDVGAIGNARHLEGMAVLYMVPYLSGRTDEAFEYYLRPGTAPQRDFEVRPAE